ncbi:hypothetical protein Ancab_013149 [Ancistrocladus abbreviatus]
METGEPTKQVPCHYDRTQELKAFDDTKAGVKGLVDAELAQELNTRDNPNLQVPIIDLKGAQQEEIAKRILSASSEWGMFQVVNHDIPIDVLEGLIEGIRRFNEEDDDAKKALYIRERTKQVKFNTNYDLYRSRAANWRDTLTVDHVRSGTQFDASQLPAICRSSVFSFPVILLLYRFFSSMMSKSWFARKFCSENIQFSVFRPILKRRIFFMTMTGDISVDDGQIGVDLSMVGWIEAPTWMESQRRSAIGKLHTILI